MRADTWYVISLVGYFAALIGLIVTAVLYFKLDIPDVLGDLTGRTVAKEIKSMRENRNRKGIKVTSNGQRYGKVTSASKASRYVTAGRRVADQTPGNGVRPSSAIKKAKNKTQDMGNGYGTRSVTPQVEKWVLHSSTGKLNGETEKLYENFDPRVEYSRTDKLEGEYPNEAAVWSHPPESGHAEPTVRKPKGTAILQDKGTAVLHADTELLDASSVDFESDFSNIAVYTEPVKFSITRSYVVVHSEESIS